MAVSNIKRDYFWNTIGVLSQNAISPLLLVVITRHNGIYDSGLFSFALSIAFVFWVISMWGGRTYQISDIQKEFTNRHYIITRLMLGIVVLGVSYLFCLANDYDFYKTSLIMALVTLKVLESIADALYGVLQLNDRLYMTGKSLLYKSVLSLIVFIIMNYITHDLIVSVLGMLVVNFLLLIFYDMPRAHAAENINLELGNTHKYLKAGWRIMLKTWPILAVNFLTMIPLNVPRYFLDMYHTGEIGYYGILAMPVTLVGLVITFILQPSMVGMAMHYTERNIQGFKKTVATLLRIACGVGGALVVATAFIGVPALGFVFGIDFHQYYYPLLIITFGAVANAVVAIFVNVYIIMRQFKVLLWTIFTPAIVMTFVASWYVRAQGIDAAVNLFFITSIVQALVLYVTYILKIRRWQS